MSGMNENATYLSGEQDGELRQADDDLIRAELAFINEKKGGPAHITRLLRRLGGDAADGGPPYLVGLALSGGGIRSATFSLGVLQRLAKAKILEQVDFLSTVSGGGYIGAALTWWLSGRSGAKGHGLGDDFPYGTADPKNPNPKSSAILRYLRDNGNYLTPGNGITIWSGLAIVIRATLLNLLVWVPIVGALFVLLHYVSDLPFLNGLPSIVGMAAPELLPTIVSAVASGESIEISEVLPAVFLLFFLVASLLTLIFIVSSVNFSLLSWMGRNRRAESSAAGETEAKSHHTTAHATGAGKDVPIQVGRSIGRWLLVGVLAIVDVALLALIALWLGGVAENMFGRSAAPAELIGGLLDTWRWAIAFTLISAAVLLIVARRNNWSLSETRGFALIFCGFAALFVLDGLFLVISHLASGSLPVTAARLGWLSGILQIVAGIGLLVLVNFWIGHGVRWLLRLRGLSLRYGGRRNFEQFFGGAIVAIIALLALGSVPLVVAWIDFTLGGMEGLLSVSAGALSALWGHSQSQGTGGDGRRFKITMILGSLLFMYGLLLLGYRLALLYGDGDPATSLGLVALLIVAVVTGWFTNVNYISLHRFYRDRLMEAFMPDHGTVQSGQTDAARGADGLRMADVWPPEPPGPFHIVNTNLVLANSTVRKYRLRGGDNFILSPLYCGSSATGWQQSDSLMNGEMTLATAMAISGAAANPRAGVGGKGVTRNRFVSLVMTLLNFRLGYWLPRPRRGAARQTRANHFHPSGLYSLFKFGYRETSDFIELSDGGHFENLAIYELVRRRCGLIIVCDGGQDIAGSYGDFVTAIQRIEQDFGATLHFDMKLAGSGDGELSGPADLIARQRNNLYPKDADYAGKGYFVATIDYGARGGGPWPARGTLIYLKTTMIPELSMKARGYKGAHPNFPDESTADQFFDEEQFEAYREVGFRIADQMISELNLSELMQPRADYAALRRNGTFAEADSS